MSNHHADIPDQLLLSHWESGDEPAFEQLYRKYFPLLVTVAESKTKDRFLAEELAQESMVAFYNSRNYEVENVPAYLQIILRNKTYDHFRKVLVNKQHHEQAVLQTPAVADDAVEQLYHADLLRIIREQIQTLPRQCRTVFLLSREQHLSNREIADKLGISVNTVEQHMRKALRRLREGVLVFVLLMLH